MEDARDDTAGTSPATSAAEELRRPSLTERLMNPQGPYRERSATEAPKREDGVTADSRTNEPGRSTPATPPPGGQRSPVPDLRFRGQVAIGSAMKDARRFIRVRYYSFVASMVVLFATLVIAVVVLALAVLGDGSWEEQAASGAVAGGALLLLILLQYKPAAGFATAAGELAQLEALQAHLERSYDLWNAYFEERDGRQPVVANDVAAAVSSMTSATRELVAAQAEFVIARHGGRNSTARPQFPTPTSPDPRRY